MTVAPSGTSSSAPTASIFPLRTRIRWFLWLRPATTSIRCPARIRIRPGNLSAVIVRVPKLLGIACSGLSMMLIAGLQIDFRFAENGQCPLVGVRRGFLRGGGRLADVTEIVGTRRGSRRVIVTAEPRTYLRTTPQIQID